MTEPADEPGDHAPEPDPEPDQPSPRQAPVDQQDPETRRPPASPRRRIAGAAVAVVVAVALGAGLWSVPAVRTVLLQSFTRQPAPFTEIYFTAAPRFDGSTLIVPVAVNAHGTGPAPLRLKLTLESAKGKVVATRTVGLKPKDGKAVPVVTRFTKTTGTTLVRVALVGHEQTLHYNFVTPKAVTGPLGTPPPDVRD
ncbi:hypothetical protein PV350_21510 [Streptomyces sp. PA03-6a]|nr:hypothetical protein [Streptomyces sp. PA03-6a]